MLLRTRLFYVGVDVSPPRLKCAHFKVTANVISAFSSREKRSYLKVRVYVTCISAVIHFERFEIRTWIVTSVQFHERAPLLGEAGCRESLSDEIVCDEKIAGTC